MKIVLLGQKEIASHLGMCFVVNGLARHDIRIFLSPESASDHNAVSTLERLEQFECGLCDDLGDAQFATRVAALGLYSLDGLVEKTGHPIGALPAPNAPDGLAVLEREHPDLLISVRYRKILKERAIAIPKYGVINLHSGVLPQYRGAMATLWAMLNRDETIGATLHYIVDGTIDTGPVIGIARRPLDLTRSYLSNVLDLYPDGCAMILNAVAEIERTGVADSTAQAGESHYYSFPKQGDFEKFASRGLRLFDADELSSFLDRYQRSLN